MAVVASTTLGRELKLAPKTYDDLLTTPDDGKRYEVICGEIVVSSSPPMKHQYALGQLAYRFHDHLIGKKLGLPLIGPYDVILSRHNVVAPDLVAIVRQRMKILTVSYADGPPDVIVEVLAPETRQRDLVTKAALYTDFGVREYWVVDPETEDILVNVLRDGQYSALENHLGCVRSDVFPGLEIRASDVFQFPDWWIAKASNETE
jgi:Uma2 family endonuclease